MALYFFQAFAVIGAVLGVAGVIALAHAFTHPGELPEVYDEDERTPFESGLPERRRTGCASGSSHQRRLARRKLYRAIKLRNA